MSRLATAGEPVRALEARRATAPKPISAFQFISVDDMVRVLSRDGVTAAQKSSLERHSASIEGYILFAEHRHNGTIYRAPGFPNSASNGDIRLQIVDAVDNVTNVAKAKGAMPSGVVAVITPWFALHHPMWRYNPKAIERFAMSIGDGHPERLLHNTIAQVRVTGWLLYNPAAAHRVKVDRATAWKIDPVTQIEYQDENGNWKPLR